MLPNDANVLTVLGVSGKEDVISNLMRYCIEASPTFRDIFLRSICDINPSGVTGVRALTRVPTDSGIPDLVIAVERPNQKHLVILENKLKADEGADQTKRYSSPECVLDVKRRLNWSDPLVTESFLFLTLFPDQEPAAATFRRVTYDDLLQAVRHRPDLGDRLAQLLLDAWVSQLERFYSKRSTSPDDVLLAKLEETDPLEGSYLYFRSFVQGICLERNLTIEFTFRSSARGRRYFGAVISKPSWHSAEMDEVAGKYSLNGKRHFNIHFEPQFHYLKGILELYVHYEVNPYAKAAWVASHIPPSQYDAYKKVREHFVETLRSKKIADLSIGGRSNQIAKARLELADLTVTQASNVVADVINRTAAHIDEILDDPAGVFSG